MSRCLFYVIDSKTISMVLPCSGFKDVDYLEEDAVTIFACDGVFEAVWELEIYDGQLGYDTRVELSRTSIYLPECCECHDTIELADIILVSPTQVNVVLKCPCSKGILEVHSVQNN